MARAEAPQRSAARKARSTQRMGANQICSPSGTWLTQEKRRKSRKRDLACPEGFGECDGHHSSETLPWGTGKHARLDFRLPHRQPSTQHYNEDSATNCRRGQQEMCVKSMLNIGDRGHQQAKQQRQRKEISITQTDGRHTGHTAADTGRRQAVKQPHRKTSGHRETPCSCVAIGR
jgi:hypothetical protein